MSDVEENKNNDNVWTWATDSLGRVLSISVQFATTFGGTSSNTIVGKTFWNFCDNLDSPNSDWKELAQAIYEKKRIHKFVFPFKAQGKIVKVRIMGVPVFDKGRFLGHQGTGTICDMEEYTTSELSQNALAMALDDLNIGIGFFNNEGILQTYNDIFFQNLIPAGLTLTKSMTVSTIVSHIKARNTIIYQFSGSDTGKGMITQEFVVETRDKSFLHIRTGTIDYGGYCVKVELISNLARHVQRAEELTRRAKEESANLIRRLEDYKTKLEYAVKDKSPTANGQNSDVEKIMNFYESQIDVGILVTDIDGTPESINYAACELFNYRTSKEFLMSIKNIKNLRGYDPLRQDIVDSMLQNGQPRQERDLEIQEGDDLIPVKEVIAIYPSVINPKKVMSFFYIQNNDTSYEEILNPEETTDANVEDSVFNGNFINNVLNNIKTSVQVISGYSDLVAYSRYSNSRENIQYIQESCVKVLDRINEVSHLYLACRNTENLENNLFDAEHVVHRIFAKYNQEILRKKIDVMIELPQCDFNLICDERVFETALGKLLENAILISNEEHKITFKIVNNLLSKKFAFVISDESSVKLQDALFQDDAENNLKNLHNVTFNMKIAKSIFEKIGFSLQITSFDGLGNTIQVTAHENILANKTPIDKDDVAV